METFYAAVGGRNHEGGAELLSADVDWSWGGIPARGRSEGGAFFEATGKNLRIAACHVVAVDDDGLIETSHVYLDLLGVLAQLGVAPAGTGA